MIRCRAVVPALCLALVCWSSPLLAWNVKGHMTVGYLAYKRLTPKARARADELLQLNPFYPQWLREIPPTLPATDRSLAIFMIATTWADQIKSDRGYRDDGTAGGNRPDGPASAYNLGYGDALRHRYWHFIDLPFSAAGMTLPSVPTPNAEDRIVLFLSVLASTAQDTLKSYDLSWLLHLVGDIHQPLHAATRVTADRPEGDNGGNDVRICTNAECSEQTSLHSVWDGALGSESSVAAAIAAGSAMASAAIGPARVLDPAAWAAESFDVAKKAVYEGPIGPGLGPFQLTPAYREVVLTTGQQRVAVAGTRLAAVLNRDLK
jgi:hypothetical protein